MEFLKEESAKKILFTGLDFAGKTSLILALQREFSKIAILKPTRSAQRRVFSFLGLDFSEWDLGGQIQYRINYLKNPSKYFDKTEVAIYVIDIQDSDRFSESISYLNDVVKQFKKLEIEPPIYIFFHKIDPALLKSATKEMNDLVVNLKARIEKYVDYKKLFYYKTSIFNLYTVMNAFSEVLLKLFPKSALIDESLTAFGKKIDAEGLIVIDDNSLMIGRYFKDEDIQQVMNMSAPYFLTLHDSFKDGSGEEPPQLKEEDMVVKRFGKYFMFKEIRFHSGSEPYYLLIANNNQWFDQKEIEEFIKIFEEFFAR